MAAICYFALAIFTAVQVQRVNQDTHDLDIIGPIPLLIGCGVTWLLALLGGYFIVQGLELVLNG